MDNFEKALKEAEEYIEKLKEIFLILKKENEEKVKLTSLEVGDVFSTEIGKFKVLEQCGECTKVISEDLYRKCVAFDDNTRNYAESELRKLCDGEIYEEFAEVFGGDNILVSQITLTSVDMQNEFGTVECKVRPLTFDEARQYNDLLVNEELSGWYWTCTPWSTKKRGWEYSIAVVSPGGNVGYNFYDCNGGVRPVCILKSNIFVSKEEK